jgi:hypothetical protein
MSKLTTFTEEKIAKIRDDAWLNVIVNEKTLNNPLDIIPAMYSDDPHLFFTYLMSRPEYFSLLCKEILNIDLFPFQSVILREMWTHKFPMLVAARGASKCITYNTRVLTNQGIKKIGEIVDCEEEMRRSYKKGLKVYTENHTWEEVEYGWCNGETETRKIELENGFTLECTVNHPIRIKKKRNEPVWVEGGEVEVGDIVPLVRPEDMPTTREVSDEYLNYLSLLSNSSSELPEVVWGLSKEQVLVYLDKLATFQENPKRFKSFSKKFLQDIQLVYFYKTGNGSKIIKTKSGLYSLYLSNKPLLESKVKSIKKGQARTYDIHMKRDHSFISNGFISHNSFTLGLYALMRAILIPGRKIIIVGSVFRQSKVIFNYLTKMYENAPLLRDANPGKGPKMFPDRCELQIGDSLITALPIGTGESIRGYRSNDTICDEFAAQSQEIFETVIAGFGSVSQSPVENAKEAAALKLLKALNLPSEMAKKDEFNKDNQIILTGSAYYYFNHFAQYWNKWKNIIYSKGRQDKLSEIFRGDIPDGFRWEDYSVLRLPVELLPPGFMDEGQIARSKATMTSSIYEMEFSACFSKDSDGFFKASSIEGATANKDNNIILPPNEDPIIFDPKVRGEPGKKYVMGIDPASEVDNFSIVIIELNKTHNRIVYCWTTNSKKFKRKLQKGLIDNKDYYGFCARKIRNLMKDFNIEHIAMDAQGGGKAVYEALQDDKNFKDGEVALLEIIEAGKKKDSDGQPGLHIIEMCQFANYDYISTANHNLKKDIEDKVLLFPRYSPSLLAISGINEDEEDLEDTSIYDTLEDCIIEIQELKTELAQIVVTSTQSGRERWDTPEVKISGSKKGRARKDRYSSLLIANAAARKIFRGETDDVGITDKLNQTSGKEPGFIGPSWATKALEDLYS